MKSPKERARERIVGDYAVEVVAQPTGNKTVKGVPGKKFQRKKEPDVRV